MKKSQAPRAQLIPVDEIAQKLADRIEDLAPRLLPNGFRDPPPKGPEWRCGSIHGEKGRSLAVRLKGPRAGVWADFSSGDRGDALDLVAKCLFGGSKTEAIKWAKGYLGLDGTDPDALKKTHAATAKRADDEDGTKEAADKRAAAYRIYLSAQENIKGTPVDTYLRGRGLDLTGLGFGVGALRYAPELKNTETNRTWPAMVATIVGNEGKQISVHRTWLQIHSDGRVTKAPLITNKMSLGSYRGGIIPLWKGVRIDAETGELKKNPPLSRVKQPCWLDITEGIEDGLSVILANPELRVIAAISVSNWANIRLPDQVEGVVLWKQNDPPHSQAARDFDKVVNSFLAQRKRVKLARPPEQFKDANDVLINKEMGVG